jgi:hypothetical protein
MTEISIPNAKRYNRVVWSMLSCADNADRMVAACFQKLLDNRYGTLVIRASGDKIEFDITLSEVGEETL